MHIRYMTTRLFIAAAILLICTNICVAYSENTHPVINEQIAKNTIGSFSLDSYLKNSLSLQNGIQTTYKGNRIWKWVSDGGYREDISTIPYARSLNHFHDPLEPWGSAGYSGEYSYLSPVSIRSSAVWAQANDQYDGDYSWVNARWDFYNALTAYGSNAENVRDVNFAKTFRALGQLMHLVQDSSVPAHVMND